MKQNNSHMFIQEGEVVKPDANDAGEKVIDQTMTNQEINSEVNPGIIKCARCGAEMKATARYCMKCGNLNYNNQENNFMKQYAIDNIKYKDYVGGLETAKNNGIEVPKEVVVYPFKACMITNLLVFMLPTLLLIIISLILGNVNMGLLIGMVVFFGVFFFLAYSYQRILIKVGENWWSFFIPFYSSYVYYKVTLRNGWLFLLSFIPIIGIIVSIIAAFQLGVKFYRSGWLTLFFPFIMIPIIGFDSNAVYMHEKEVSLKKYKSSRAIDGHGKSKAEKGYRARKFVFSLIVLVAFAFTIWLGWDYIKMAYEFFLEQLEFFK